MDFDEFQQKALATAIYPHPIVYPTLGLTGEAGEVADKVKKVIRDNQGEFGDERRLEIAKEIGDVLWYCAMLAHDLGYTFDQIAQINCDKIAARKNAGTIHGEGHNRYGGGRYLLGIIYHPHHFRFHYAEMNRDDVCL